MPIEEKKPAVPMVVPVYSHRGNVTIPIILESSGARRRFELQLTAGPNMVPVEHWEAAKKQPGVRRMLNAKIQAVKAQEQQQAKIGKSPLEEGKPVPAAAPLSGMSETEAVELVKDSADASMLGVLLKAESRGPVRRAIEGRLQEIKDPAKAASQAEAAAGSTKASISLA